MVSHGLDHQIDLVAIKQRYPAIDQKRAACVGHCQESADAVIGAAQSERPHSV